MHVEFLVEDRSAGKAMEILAPKLLGDISHRIIPYRGIGHIPPKLSPEHDPQKRLLLDQLPRLLRGYGKIPGDSGYIVVVICDLDRKDKTQFSAELDGVLDACDPKPKTIFCLAIEEFEAWYLGDLSAVRMAYPKAKNGVLAMYRNDSICGTWEVLADAVYRGGHKELKKRGYQIVGTQKSEWAKEISPHMNIQNNSSPSFCHMREKLQEILG